MTDATELDEAANGMTPVDPALIEVDEWLNVCGSCDAGLPVACSCPTTDPRPVITRLLAALDEARAEAAQARDYVDGCLREAAHDLEMWQDRAEAAESALAAAEQERDEAVAALTLQRHETSLVREARGEAMAEVEHWRALAERAWDEAVDHVWELSDPVSTIDHAEDPPVCTVFDMRQAKRENPCRAAAAEIHVTPRRTGKNLRTVEQFNDLVPIGTPVLYWPGVREGEGRRSVTRSAAWLLGGHTPVVMVDGYPGGIALSHVMGVAR